MIFIQNRPRPSRHLCTYAIRICSTEYKKFFPGYQDCSGVPVAALILTLLAQVFSPFFLNRAIMLMSSLKFCLFFHV